MVRVPLTMLFHLYTFSSAEWHCQIRMSWEAFLQEPVRTKWRFCLRTENVTRYLSGVTGNLTHIFTVPVLPLHRPAPLHYNPQTCYSEFFFPWETTPGVARFQQSTAVQMRSLIFCDNTQRRLLVTADVSGQPCVPIFKDQAVQEEDPWRRYRQVVPQRRQLRNIPEERRSQYRQFY